MVDVEFCSGGRLPGVGQRLGLGERGLFDFLGDLVDYP